MAGWGGFLVLMGLGSFALNLAGMEFKILMWVDTWGPIVGNCIRLGIAALGGVMFMAPKLAGRA
jgi:hypothetical protein